MDSILKYFGFQKSVEAGAINERWTLVVRYFKHHNLFYESLTVKELHGRVNVPSLAKTLNLVPYSLELNGYKYDYDRLTGLSKVPVIGGNCLEDPIYMCARDTSCTTRS